MKNISILLVEDDIDVQKKFINLADKYNEFDMIGITNSSLKALEIINRLYPDVIILDLELNNGEGNGSDVLEGLKKINYDPFVVVTTNVSSTFIHNAVRNLGADYIFFKQKMNYSEEEVFKFILTMQDSIVSHVSFSTHLFESSEVINIKNKEIEQFLQKEFKNLGMSNKLSGYAYLTEAIRLKVFNPAYDKKTLCQIIAQERNKTIDSVAHSMQHAITKVWNRSDYNDLIDAYDGYVDSNICMPTVLEFINHYADKVKHLFDF